VETSEIAQENLESVHHHGADRSARRIAVLIAALAAMLALCEMGEKAAQNAYLTHHIQISDTWAFFQAKNIRATTLRGLADIMDSLPNAGDAAVKQRAAAARATADRLDDDPKAGDGRKQLTAKATAEEQLREAAFHRYHMFEFTVGALQIAIVLASVSVVTRVLWLAFGAAAIGGAAGLFGLATIAGLV
jgi:hypothetical protein